MRFRRGFFRIWVVLFTLWILFWGYDLTRNFDEWRAWEVAQSSNHDPPTPPGFTIVGEPRRVSLGDGFLVISFPAGRP